jgi:hypothetical protein
MRQAESSKLKEAATKKSKFSIFFLYFRNLKNRLATRKISNKAINPVRAAVVFRVRKLMSRTYAALTCQESI